MMNTFLRSLFLFVTLTLTTSFTAMADKDIPVRVSELPLNAQRIIKNNFAGKRVTMAKKEMDDSKISFEVKFSGGEEIEFNEKGRWKKISCERKGVPASLIPQKIRHYITRNHLKAFVVEIERNKKGFEVELSNDVELKFDKEGHLLEVED